jgi:hypothetical protein
MSEEAVLAAFWEHMDRCRAVVLAPMGRPDVKVTIIVRAPEALPSECMISTNDDLSVVADAVAHWAARR